LRRKRRISKAVMLLQRRKSALEQPAPLPAAGTLVYKSVDKDGKTVFTDTPPDRSPRLMW
jgi:hypothetical protein